VLLIVLAFCVVLCFCVLLVFVCLSLVGVRVAHRFSFLCCVVFLWFVSLRLMSCMPNVPSVSVLSIIDWPFDYLICY
jgi:hypothetical protein